MKIFLIIALILCWVITDDKILRIMVSILYISIYFIVRCEGIIEMIFTESEKRFIESDKFDMDQLKERLKLTEQLMKAIRQGLTIQGIKRLLNRRLELEQLKAE